MKRSIWAGFLVTAFLLVGACASHKYTVLEPRKKELTDYQILEIRDFKCNLGDSESKELTERFADRLYLNILKERKDNET